MANSCLINTESRTQTHADDVRRHQRCADPQISRPRWQFIRTHGYRYLPLEQTPDFNQQTPVVVWKAINRFWDAARRYPTPSQWSACGREVLSSIAATGVFIACKQQGRRLSTWLVSRWLTVDGSEVRFFSGSVKIRSARIGSDSVPEHKSVCSLATVFLHLTAD